MRLFLREIRLQFEKQMNVEVNLKENVRFNQKLGWNWKNN